MEILGLIPARLGSTGVKRKNIRPLANRPLITYTIEAALESGLDRVILSTESDEIADVGRQAGVEVPFMRPAEFAGTESKAIEVVSHALGALQEINDWCPDAVMYLQPTSPFRTATHIDDAIAAFRGSTSRSVVSVCPAEVHPAYMYLCNEAGELDDVLDPAIYRAERRQDLVPAFSLNNAIMLSDVAYLTEAVQSDGLIVDLNNFQPIFIDGPAAIDINTEKDFLFADFAMRRQKGMTA